MPITIGLLIELLINALPYPTQIKDIEVHEDRVNFVWRAAEYRASTRLEVEEVQGGCLLGTECAILMRALVISAYAAHLTNQGKE